MSKVSLRSGTSNTRVGSQRKRKHQGKRKILKPYDFCCSVENVDPLTRYDRLRSIYRPSLMSVQAINESPTLKLRTEFTDHMEELESRKRNKQFDIGDHRRKTDKRSKQYLQSMRRRRGRNGHRSRHKLSNGEDDVDDEDDYEDLYDKRTANLSQGPIISHLEDEITRGKDVYWEQREKTHNEEVDKNTAIGRRNSKKNRYLILFPTFMISLPKFITVFLALLMVKEETNMYPRWYQDFSINQLQDLKMLQCIMHKDCEEMVTGRTQRTLISIGIVSTFFTLSPDLIRKLQESSNCNVIDFLREIYKVLTGNYFEEEGYKKFYDCNERIILSAIAFLTLPEAIVELHKRLPPVKMPKLRPKPMPAALPTRQRMESPYQEELFARQDWTIYYNRLQDWRQRRRLIPIPNLILPPKDCVISSFPNTNANPENEGYTSISYSQNNQLVPVRIPSNQTKRAHDLSPRRKPENSVQARQSRNVSIERRDDGDSAATKKQKRHSPVKGGKNNPTDNYVDSFELNEDADNLARKEGDAENGDDRDYKRRRSTISSMPITEQRIERDPYKVAPLDVRPLYGENRLFDFTINGICEKPGPVEYKICGVLQPPQPNKKSWLDEKHAHYIISGASDEPPSCPVTYEMTGIANVTPTNSNERFFAVLKLGDGSKKIFPGGRKNLSRHWQEWLQSVDEEFRKVEREANKMIKSIEAVTKLVFPKPTCDSCCSCRQTRKSYLKAKETKAPYFVIDTIIEDDNKKKVIVGAMSMHSPAPTPPESTVNLLEVIASKDVLTDNVVISGVTNETGETQYFITGSQKEVVRVPARVIERPPPRPPRNVPPCVCAIQQMFNKGLIPTLSHDNIPWTKDEGLCFGKKFRPQESPAYSCKKYPGDKSCRRSPFMYEIARLKRRAQRAKQKEKGDTGERKMYSIADFQPCGDEHGMGICGGPWGAKHTLTPEELEQLERQRKEILRGPPCGVKPGRAICEGPFGARIPIKPSQVVIEEEIPGEEEELEEEEEVEEEEEAEAKVLPEVKEKERKRDEKCHMSPDSIEKRKRVAVKEVKKFVPDPSYPGYDDPWNIFRTAPSAKESETDFKKLLKLSSPKPPATPVQSRAEIGEGEQSGLREDVSESDAEKSSPKVSKSARKVSPTPVRSKSEQISKKRVAGSLKSEEGKGKGKLTSRIFDKRADQSSEAAKAAEVATSDNAREQKLLKSKRSKQSEKMDENPKSSATQKLKNPKGWVAKSKKFTAGKEQSLSQLGQVNKKSKQSLHDVPNYESDKRDRKTKGSKKLSSKSISFTNVKKRKGRKQSESRKRSVRRDKKKDTNVDQDVDPEAAYKKIYELKNMIKSSENYPYDVQPVDIPKAPPGKCQLEYEDTEPVADSAQADEDLELDLPSKGPCGWRTKSEQKLPTKKTLVYLSEPDYPPETVPVKPGGKPCLCRENRAKKKILLYNIGGLIGGKKEVEEKKLFKKKKDDEKQMQVIDGAIYYTPPPSPRRSDEYVPEYDLYESPYDMCVTQRKDRGLKFLEKFGQPKITEVPGNAKSCGCNEYVDTYGIRAREEDEEKARLTKELDSTRERLISAKPPKERWNLALKDVGLIDYFTRCRDNMPCWLRCAGFNKVGCPIPYRKLKTKRPVCECKYERKILEHKEEKLKWKERQKRLKSYKKQPYVNVADISKPLIPNTKLMISGVKRIPKDNEYVDDVKYCITGVAENYSHLPPKQVLGGVHMATPIQTPEPSVQEIPCVCLHRHWSPLDIPPGPLPKPEEILLAEKRRRQEAVKEAFRQMYAPEPVYHTHEDHGCKETCGENSDVEDDEDARRNSKYISGGGNRKASLARKSATVKGRVTNPTQNREQYVKSYIDNPRKSADMKVRRSNREAKNTNVQVQKAMEGKARSSQRGSKDIKNERNEERKRLNAPRSFEYGEIKDDTRLQSTATELDNTETVDDSNVENGESLAATKGGYLMAIVKIELKKMAAEGFLFAKLPKCFLMPQLRYWLMYRKGFALSDLDKHKSVRKSGNMWNMLDMISDRSTVHPEPLKMTKVQLRKLTFDDAPDMKEKIAMKKAMFYSRVRKQRVLYGRSMWNTMEYGKFPSISYKQAYFTYMAAKEADGFVFKPWLPSEVREMN